MRKTIIVLLIFTTYSAVADINTGLVAHWTFDNDSLVVLDKSGNSFNGKAYNISFEKGIIGKAATFDAVNDRIIISDKLNKLPDRIAKLDSGSISVWFKFQSAGGQVLPLFYYGESSSGEPHNSMIIEIGHGENSQNRRLYFTIVHSKFCFDTKINLEDNKWYHFVAVVGSNGNTKLEVLDLLGRKVKTLVDEFKQQGDYTLHFDSKELPSGTYFYQLKVGNNITTGKMMIMK